VPVLCQGFLLHSLAGSPLPAEQGGPFRLLIPEQAGAPLGACANVKGVAKLVVR
jgi:DMSO/TMAO reductase YedYZ molybdopterin-dependent catalytic subunit